MRVTWERTTFMGVLKIRGVPAGGPTRPRDVRRPHRRIVGKLRFMVADGLFWTESIGAGCGSHFPLAHAPTGVELRCALPSDRQPFRVLVVRVDRTLWGWVLTVTLSDGFVWYLFYMMARPFRLESGL